MKPFLKKVLLFFSLFLAISYLLIPVLKSGYQPKSKQQWVLSLKDQQYDYAVLGSSRVLNMIDIHSLNGALQQKGVNLGTSGSNYAENYMLWELFLTNNKVARLYLNVDELCFNSDSSYSYPFHDYEYLNYYPNETIQSVYNDYLPSWKSTLWQLVPASRYIEFNDNYSTLKEELSDYGQSQGAELLDDPAYKSFKALNYKKQYVIDPLDKKYFLKIIESCKQHKVELEFITTPMFQGVENRSKGRSEVYAFIEQTAQELHIPYHQYDGLIDISDTTLFRDFTHTNAQGSLIYCKNLGEKLTTSLSSNQ